MQLESQGPTSNIKSVSTAVKILEIVARNDGPISLKSISAEATVSPSKAHRYVQSLCACGLLNQERKSGTYDLGLFAMRLGLAAINRVDIVNRTGEALPGLVEDLDADAFISVWSDLGPTIVRFEKSAGPSIAMLGPGMTFPLFSSATGMVFLAYASRIRIHEAMQRELGKKAEIREKSAADVAALIGKIQERGYAYTTGMFFAGRQCAAAPMLSLDDRILAAVSFVSREPDSVKPESKQICRLLEFCRHYSLPKRGYFDETFIEQKIAI